jgi:hypothetical protein
VDILNEHYMKSQEAVSADNFIKFGLTDSVILTLAKGNYLVLTDDLKLVNYLQNLEVDVINFNNIPVLNWEISISMKIVLHYYCRGYCLLPIFRV